MKLEEAERWLRENASTQDAALAQTMASRKASGVPTILPTTPDMWGPEDYADWSHDDLVWRLVFLQCVLRRMAVDKRYPQT